MYTTNTTKVSIILPVFNGGDSVGRSIESVLAQSSNSWELIAIDDGSTDKTAEIILKYCNSDSRIFYFKNDSNLGIQKSLNKGIQIAQGKYIARIDSDDVWIDSNKLLNQKNFLDAHPQYGLVGTGAMLVSKEGEDLSRYLSPLTDDAIRQRILGKNCFVHASVLMRKDILNIIGGYSESKNTRHVEDHELWMRFGTVSKITNIPEYSVALTVSSGSITAKHRVVQAWRMLKLCLLYRKKYKHFLKNFCICFARLLFFSFNSLFPVRASFIYSLQSKIKNI